MKQYEYDVIELKELPEALEHKLYEGWIIESYTREGMTIKREVKQNDR